jgi:hydroxyacyl-ACP dehydratase HTD2-like protein with hotdog domain
MLGRDIISSREYIDENIDHKLTDTLCTFLPPSWCRRIRGDGKVVPVGHHLVWFNASMPVDQLLPDGTDPLQSPGEPWVRRMWAGGSVRISPEAYYDQGTGFATDSSVVCAEHIADVQLRGNGDAAKIFVTIERRFARHDSLLEKHVAPLRGIQSASKRSLSPQWHFREQLRSKAWGDAILIEQRNLVFLKDKTTAELDAIKAGNMVPVKYLKRQSTQVWWPPKD